MNSYVQLLILVVSFIYGFLVFYLNKVQVKLLRKKNLLSKIVIMVLYCNLLSLLYLFFLIKINSGVLHLYFVLVFLVGYYVASVKKRK